MPPKKSKRKYFCKCGCGGRIKIKKWHKWYGVPDFVQGHGRKGKKASPATRELLRQKSLGNQRAKGYKHSLAERKKMKGRKVSPATRKLLSKLNSGENHPMYGKHPSPETIAKRKLFRHTPETIKKMKGRKVSPATRELLRQGMLGKKNSKGCKRSDATKRKISMAISGNNHWNYGKHIPLAIRIKMGKSQTGRKASPATKEKLRNRKISFATREKLKKHRLRQIFPIKDTSIEVKLQKALTKQKIKFKKHEPITGQPDIFIEPNICIFADGDYWHNLEKGKKRDKYVNRTLKEAGYVILRFWEHQINKDLAGCLNKISEIC